jgi:hypothetical protein
MVVVVNTFPELGKVAVAVAVLVVLELMVLMLVLLDMVLD